MQPLKFRLVYTGQDADRHILPAYDGARSIEGLSWAFSLLGNYLATGQIRKRGTLDPRIRFYMSPAARGSYTTDIIAFIVEPQNLFVTSLLGNYVVTTSTNTINAFMRHSFRRVCGLFDGDDDNDERLLKPFPSGDLEATLDAIEPAMIRAHGVIDNGADTLTLIKGRTPLIEMSSDTKAYVNKSIIGEKQKEVDASVGALNVNSGNGRVYLEDIGKTVPFSVVKEPEQGTYQALSSSLDRYARGIPSKVGIKYLEVLAIDGRIKKLLIVAAYPVSRHV
ncbi:hypothetical protein [Microvirga brassicacearum]|uniref:Uncharacterized protein n=1 Tax=Microvirga brassicacearum TaxID=2580413 RepID=A0A5N3PH95_9HYPH|nr:hypothetical protein [Microvirga brassicacearum]KAB0269090.1 hypothetical protein FEZ63_02985 [Microvirga brassicacearum]